MQKKLPVGIQNFREIIEEGHVYVDKTQYIYDLISGAKYYFLSRPRRFGKSLLLDTIGEVFKGSKELFKGLFIYDSDYDFKEYPVIRLDMSNIPNDTPEIFKSSILDDLKTPIEEEGFSIANDNPAYVFKHLIRNLHKKYSQRVVVLIDEYDKPILDHITDNETAEANRRIIRGFYGVLKSMDPHLRFIFVTGVSKFTKTSLFSELNNLTDITLTESYANICGIDVEDLGSHFGEHIKSLSALENFKDLSDIHGEILRWYDGYSWDGKTRLLNPFGLLSFFMQKRFSSFWYSSGSPKFLLDLIKENPESFTALKNLEVAEAGLDIFEIQRMEIEPLLFQTGYLTIKEKRFSGGVPVYILDMPNFEVREAFNLHLIAEFTGKSGMFADNSHRRISESLKTGDLLTMRDILRSLFASIPYSLHIDMEAYYHSIFYAVMSILGFDMDAEVSVSKGRVDAVLELEDKVYVMEFKYKDVKPDTSPIEKQELFEMALEEGMEQIKDRGYHKKYEGSGKAVYLSAFAFLGRDDIEVKAEHYCTPSGANLIVPS